MAIAELLATDLASVQHALEAGADRIELCAALEVGGVTPGIGLLIAAVRLAEASGTGAGVTALIRPRRGDFLLDGSRGLALLQAEVEAARDAGAEGVAVGVLTEGAEVDFAAMEALVAAAGATKVTFHRAMDHARDPLGAVERLVSIGVARVLTSGSAPSALEGASQIRAMTSAARERIEIVAAGGIHGANAAEVLRRTGAPAIHGSCSHLVGARGAPGAASQRGDEPHPVSMSSAAGALPENVRSQLDPVSAAAFVAAAHGASLGTLPP